MAQVVNVVLSCDRHRNDADGAPDGARTVRFSFNGRDYEIDLCPACEAIVRESFQALIGDARPARPRKSRSHNGTGNGDQASTIRAWARSDEGQQILGGAIVNERGKVRPDIVAQYKAWHGLAQ
jgi:hypothetical protein